MFDLPTIDAERDEAFELSIIDTERDEVEFDLTHKQDSGISFGLSSIGGESDNASLIATNASEDNCSVEISLNMSIDTEEMNFTSFEYLDEIPTSIQDSETRYSQNSVFSMKIE